MNLKFSKESPNDSYLLFYKKRRHNIQNFWINIAELIELEVVLIREILKAKKFLIFFFIDNIDLNIQKYFLIALRIYLFD